jgi:excisionase family DNA binding protein
VPANCSQDERQSILSDGFVDVPFAARYLAVSRVTVYALMDSGDLPSAKFGRCRRIPRQALLDYARKQLLPR